MPRSSSGCILLLVLAFGLGLAQQLAPDSPAAAARQDSWKILGPGGGGSQYHPTISPYDTRRVLVSCDMTGAYLSLDGGDSWRMFNLRGTIRFFAFDPLDRQTIYLSGVGLWRSPDMGKTWELVLPDPESVSGLQMASDHADTSIATTDGKQQVVVALAVDPSSPNTLYAAIAQGGSTALNISTDRGKTWRVEIPLPGGAKAIYADPRSRPGERTIYVVGDSSVLVREGGRWKTGTIPAGAGSFADVSLGFPRDGSKPVIYITAPVAGSGAGGLFISEDGGSTWQESSLVAPSAGVAKPNVVAVATSLFHPNVAYASYNSLRTGEASGETFFGVAKTADRGRTWKLVWKESRTSAPNIHDVWISERFGPGWGENPFQLGVSPTEPNLCYGTDWGRTMRTTDGGENWEGVYSKRLPGGGFSTTGLDVTTAYGVHFDPFDRKRLFISYTDIGLFQSVDGGTTWTSVTAGVPDAWVNTTYWMEFDPEVRGRAWCVASGTHDLPRPKMWRKTDPASYQGGVCISEDGGETWKRSGANLPNTAATHILLDPTSPVDARVLYVAGFGKGIFKSTDGGKTWSLKNQGIDGSQPFAWRLARDRNGILYLVLARRSEDGSYGNSRDGALYRSKDGAEHWEKMSLPEGLNGPNGIAIDPQAPSRLYLAAWGRLSTPAALQGGVFLSTDGGGSWRSVLDKDQHIYDVTIDPRDAQILYACGFESSAWRSADRGETWQRINGYNFKWGHRIIPDPYNPLKIFITTFGGSVWYGPAAGDPSAVEDITTPQVAYGK